MNLNTFRKIYLWMPTFRNHGSYIDGKDSEFGLPVVDIDSLCKINDILQQKNELLILKLHPFDANKLKSIHFDHIKEIKNEEIPYPYSLYDLIARIDVLITDYSSVYIDFLLTNKPICFVFDDIIEYRNTRGFAFEPIEKYMPGPQIHTSRDLVEYFDKNTDNDKYKLERARIKNLFHTYCDGNSSERILKAMGVE